MEDVGQAVIWRYTHAMTDDSALDEVQDNKEKQDSGYVHRSTSCALKAFWTTTTTVSWSHG